MIIIQGGREASPAARLNQTKRYTPQACLLESGQNEKGRSFGIDAKWHMCFAGDCKGRDSKPQGDWHELDNMI